MIVILRMKYQQHQKKGGSAVQTDGNVKYFPCSGFTCDSESRTNWVVTQGKAARASSTQVTPVTSCSIRASSEIRGHWFKSCICWWCGGVWRCRCSSDLSTQLWRILWIGKGWRTAQSLPIPTEAAPEPQTPTSPALEGAGSWGSHSSRGVCISFSCLLVFLFFAK